MTSLKTLNEVMRTPKLYAQTKAIYTYLWIRADNKSGLSYPPRKQMLEEIQLTEPLLKQGLIVLEKQGYIKPMTKELKDKDDKPYTVNGYEIIELK